MNANSFMGDILSSIGLNNHDQFNLYNQSIEAHQQRRANLSNEIEALRKAAGISLSDNNSTTNTSNTNTNTNDDNMSTIASTIYNKGDNNSDHNNNFSSGISADFSLASQQNVYSSHDLQTSPNPITNYQHSQVGGSGGRGSVYHHHSASQRGSANHLGSQSAGSDNSPYNQPPGWQRIRIAQQCVNNLEAELDASRNEYTNLMRELGERLKSEARKLGNCVEKARPLFDVQRSMRRMQSEVQSASISYKKAQNLKDAAKNMVKAAEHKVKECEKIKANGKDVGSLMNWLEQLNQSNDNFQIASKTSQALAAQHSKAAKEFTNLQKKVQALETTSAVKYLDQARPYFNLQLDLWSKAEQHGTSMVRLEASLAEAKAQLASTIAQNMNKNQSDSQTHRLNDMNSPNSEFSDQSSRTTSGDSHTNNFGPGSKLSQLNEIDDNQSNSQPSPQVLRKNNPNNANNTESAIQTMKLMGVPGMNRMHTSPNMSSPAMLRRNLDLPGSRYHNSLHNREISYDDEDALEDILQPTQLFNDNTLSREPSGYGHPNGSPRRDMNRKYSYENYKNHGNFSTPSNQNNSQKFNNNNQNNTHTSAEDDLINLTQNIDLNNSNPSDILKSIGFYKDNNLNENLDSSLAATTFHSSSSAIPNKINNLLTSTSSSSKYHSKNNPYSLVMLDGENLHEISDDENENDKTQTLSNQAKDTDQESKISSSDKEINISKNSHDLDFDEDF